MNSIKKTTQTTAQAIARQVREQSNEILKSATLQVSTGHESSSKPTPTSPEVSNPIELKQKEQELLSKWRARISEIQAEESRAHRERSQSTENWRREQEELMKEPEKEAQVFVEAQGKTKHAPEGGQAQIRQQQQKHELGRGAKN